MSLVTAVDHAVKLNAVLHELNENVKNAEVSDGDQARLDAGIRQMHELLSGLIDQLEAVFVDGPETVAVTRLPLVREEGDAGAVKETETAYRVSEPKEERRKTLILPIERNPLY